MSKSRVENGTKSQLELWLGEQESHIIPAQTETRGLSAITSSNENINLSDFEKAKRERPSGYLLMVGAGAGITFLELFNDSCQGLVMVDVLPGPVLYGRTLIKACAKYETFDDYSRRMFYGNHAELVLDEVIKEEEDEQINKAFVDCKPDILKRFGKYTLETDLQYEEEYGKRIRQLGRKKIIPLVAFRDNYQRFRELARTGKTYSLWADIFDPKLLHLLASLPHYPGSSNVVYLSNAVDHKFGQDRSDDCLKRVNCLEILDSDGTLFIHTTRYRLWRLGITKFGSEDKHKIGYPILDLVEK